MDFQLQWGQCQCPQSPRCSGVSYICVHVHTTYTYTHINTHIHNIYTHSHSRFFKNTFIFGIILGYFPQLSETFPERLAPGHRERSPCEAQLVASRSPATEILRYTADRVCDRWRLFQVTFLGTTALWRPRLPPMEPHRGNMVCTSGQRHERSYQSIMLYSARAHFFFKS